MVIMVRVCYEIETSERVRHNAVALSFYYTTQCVSYLTCCFYHFCDIAVAKSTILATTLIFALLCKTYAVIFVLYCYLAVFFHIACNNHMILLQFFLCWLADFIFFLCDILECLLDWVHRLTILHLCAVVCNCYHLTIMPNFNSISSGVLEPQVAENRYLPLTIWNDLPVDIRSTDITREQFKRSLKIWLFECVYGRRRLWETVQSEDAPKKWTDLLTNLLEVSPLQQCMHWRATPWCQVLDKPDAGQLFHVHSTVSYCVVSYCHGCVVAVWLCHVVVTRDCRWHCDKCWRGICCCSWHSTTRSVTTCWWCCWSVQSINQ